MKKRYYYIEAMDKDTGEITFLKRFTYGLTILREKALCETKKQALSVLDVFEEYCCQHVFDKYTYRVRCTWEDSETWKEELKPQFDNAKSFYRRAYVEKTHTGYRLTSYDSEVAEISDGRVFLGCDWDYSRTTLRHVKEFLKQQGYKADSKDQIKQLYW